MGAPAGRFRHRVAIQRNVPTVDPSGIRKDQWVTLEGCESVPARISTAGGFASREFIAAQQMQSEVRMRVTIRWRPGDFTGALRIVHNGRYLNAKGFLPDSTSGKITLTAYVTEGVNAG